MADPFISQLMGNPYNTGTYNPSAVETQYGLDPSNTIAGARPLPKLTLTPLSPSINPRVSAMSNLSTIRNDAWADPTNGWSQFWNGVKGAGESALNFLDRGHQAVDSTLNDLLTGNAGNIGGDVWNSLKGSKTDANFGQILNNMGWKQNNNGGFMAGLENGLRNTVGFLGDVATDPLTYLTFGEGSVAKAGLKAMKEFRPLAEADAISNGLTRGTKAFDDHVNTWLNADPRSVDAYHQALADNSKSLLNFNIPFGPETSLLNKPAFMQKQTMNVNSTLAAGLAQKMEQAGLTSQQRYDLMSHLLGRPVTSTKDLNTQEFDYLNNLWDHHLQPSVAYHFDPAKVKDPFSTLPKPQTLEDWQHFLGNHFESVMGQPLPADFHTWNLEDMNTIGPYIHQLVNATKGEVPQHVLDTALQGVKDDHAKMLSRGIIPTRDGMTGVGAYKEYRGLSGFSPLAQKLILNKQGELTNLGKAQEQFGKLFGSKRFVGLGQQMKNHALVNGAKHVLGAHNWSWAHKVDAINRIKKEMVNSSEFKSLTPDEWKEVSYAIEGKRPSYAGYTAPTPERQAVIDKVAGKYNDLKSKMDDFEKSHGITYDNGQFLQNYFRHYYNLPKGTSFDDIVAELTKSNNPSAQRHLGSLVNSKGQFLKSRNGFDSMASLEDFLHDPNVADHLKEKFANTTYNPAEVLAKRHFEGFDKIAQMRAINGIKKEGLAAKLGKSPAGWSVIHDIKGLEGLHGHVVPNDIHDMLTKSGKLLTSEKDLNHFMDQADKIMTMMRKNYTVTRVGFHSRQLVGHIFHNLLAGIKPSSVAQALKYLKNPEKYADWTHELLQHNILHGGESSADLIHSLDTELKSGVNAKGVLQQANPFGNQFILGKLGQKFGSNMDNVSRIAHYMQRRSEGMTKEAAADSVRKYLFNYNEINGAGRAWRLAIPFYQWMRNNLPLQLANLVKNPKSYQMVQHFLNDFQQAPNANDIMQQMGIGGMINQKIIDQLVQENGGVLPKYIQDNYVKLPWKDGQGNDVYYNLALPSQDVKSFVSNPLNFVLSGVNPILQALYEVHNNASNLNGAPIDKFVPKGQSVAMSPAGMEYLANSTFGTPAQMLTGLLDLGMTGNGGNLLKSVGLNTSDINNKQAIADLLYNKRNELVTRASQIKKAVTKQAFPNGYGTGGN